MGSHQSIGTTLWSLGGNDYEESSLNNYGSQKSFPADSSLLVAQNCHGALVVKKIVSQVGAKVTDTRIQRKAHGVSIDISTAVP